MNPVHDSFSHFITQELNPPQQQAVQQSSGSLLVIAGAGSGKTRVITARIAHLILNCNVEPHEIVALTFTNKAATEMLERIAMFLGENFTHRKPFIGTFHGYCLKLLKSNSHLLPYPHFSILDSDDQQTIAKGIIDRHALNKQTSVSQLLYYISHIKNHGVDPEHLNMPAYAPAWVFEAYQDYETVKKTSHAFDFDDLLLHTLSLLKHNATFQQSLQEKVRHILVDEYQDTNLVQHELLKYMATRHEQCILDSLTAVGDEDQSIYSWRGANVTNMKMFKQDFAPTTVIKLEQNYRSVQPILEIANAVITHNTQRTPKSLFSTKIAHDRIRHFIFLSDQQERTAIAHYISLASKHQKRSSIAILYRTHSQSRSIEEGLIRHNIPYTIIGGIQFYERKEIKDLLAYLRLVVNPFDRTAFKRIFNCPPRLLGDKFEELFELHWKQNPFTPFDGIVQQLLDHGTVQGAKKHALQNLLAIFKGLTAATAPSAALDQIITTSNYKNYITKSYDTAQAAERLATVQELLNAVSHLEQTALTTEQFLHDVTLMQEKKIAEEHEQDRVLLMTLHAAKGLEFHTVIMAGLEEGLLPSSRSLNDVEKIQEERRLLYVGITRAQERLLITQCRYRALYGKTSDQLVSRFMQELPEHYVKSQDCTSMNPHHLESLFTTWLSGISAPTVPLSHQTHKHTITLREQKAQATHPIWKKHSPVKHAIFGIGIIQKIEQRSSSVIFLEIAFKQGVKKISADFVTLLP